MSNTTISRSALEHFRRRLLDRQRSLFTGIEGVDADLRSLEESRESELEERAQQEALTRLLGRLEERDQNELTDIYRALAKITSGAFGVCESCRRRIALERLELDPGVRRCVGCESAREAAPVAAEERFEARSGRAVPAEYADLDDTELAEAVRERVHLQGDPDLDRVTIRCHNGAVRLSGDLPSDSQRQVILQLIEDGMGLESIDRLRVVALDREDTGEDRRGEEGPPPEERIPEGRGMQPLAPERPSTPQDEEESAEEIPDAPVPEKE